VFPMLAGIVVVGRQRLPVLDHRLDRLRTVPKRLLKLLALRYGSFAILGVHHRLKMTLDSAPLFFAHRVDHGTVTVKAAPSVLSSRTHIVDEN